jgi:hypothetical protein
VFPGRVRPVKVPERLRPCDESRTAFRGSPDRSRTGVTALRGRRPGPLDDGTVFGDRRKTSAQSGTQQNGATARIVSAQAWRRLGWGSARARYGLGGGAGEGAKPARGAGVRACPARVLHVQIPGFSGPVMAPTWAYSRPFASGKDHFVHSPSRVRISTPVWGIKPPWSPSLSSL